MDTAILSASAGLIGSWVTQHKLLGTQTRMHHAEQRAKSSIPNSSLKRRDA